MKHDELLNQNQVAEKFGVSTKTLEAMRHKGSGPHYHKFGRRVLYSREELDQYLHKNTYRSTSDY